MSDLVIPGIGAISSVNEHGPLATAMRPIEDAFVSIGLKTPLLRLGGISGGTAIALFYCKPSYFFDAGGNSRPWSVWSSGDDGVLVPWWLASFLAGAGAALFF